MESKSQQKRLSFQVNKLFVYGILKRGSQLDLTKRGCKFLGEAQINGANLYRISFGVGLRLVEDPTKVAHGELFEIPYTLWRWLDQIEQNGHFYTRKIVKVTCVPNQENLYAWRHAANLAALGESCNHEECNTDAWVYEHTYPGFEYKNLIKSGKY